MLCETRICDACMGVFYGILCTVYVRADIMPLEAIEHFSKAYYDAPTCIRSSSLGSLSALFHFRRS
jgi:hypothetical protein